MLILLASLYTVSCEQKKASKLEMLRATRDELGNAEQAVMECDEAVQKIEAEIAILRDKVIEKKAYELNLCKTRFNHKINSYKSVYKSLHGREATQAHITNMKNRLGIDTRW